MALLIVVGFIFAAAPSQARNPQGKWSILGVDGTPPLERKHCTMVYDPGSAAPGDERVLMYGGEAGPGVVFGEVWALNLGDCPSWVELTSIVGGPPTERHGHTAVYDAAQQRMIIWGGRQSQGLPVTTESQMLQDAWALSLMGAAYWDSISAGPGSGYAWDTRCGDCMYEPYCRFWRRTHSAAAMIDGDMHVFAGFTVGQAAMGDAWMLSGFNDSWSSAGNTTPGGGCSALMPDRRYWHTMITDTGQADDHIVVFGGVYEDAAISNAYWSTDGENWTHLGEAPGRERMFHSAVYDAAGARMLVIGGYQPPNKQVIYDTVTELDLPSPLPSVPALQPGAWDTLEPSGDALNGIAEHAAVYDPVNDRVLVFGGVDANGSLRANDVWVLDFADIPPTCDTTPPSAVVLSGKRGRTTATLSWTAPGDDGTTGTATSYELRRSTGPITVANFESAQLVSTYAPQSSGSTECVEFFGNQPCQAWWYALRTYDDVGNVSPLSNVLQMSQKCHGNEVLCGGGGGFASRPDRDTPPSIIEYAIASGNPTSARQSITYGIPVGFEGLPLEISVYDVAGRRVRILESGVAAVGRFGTVWDLRSSRGDRVSNGVYFARLKLGTHSRTTKIVVVP